MRGSSARGRRRRARAARRPSRASAERPRGACATRSSRRSRARSPPVSFQTSQVSTVPNASPARVRARAAATRASSPRSTGRATSPVRSRISSASSSRQRSAVRRSCQTIAGATGLPVARSQSSVVSRWFVIAIVSTPSSPRPRRRGEDALPRSPRDRARPSPAAGSAAAARRSRDAVTRRSSSTTRHVVPVVPWSIARITTCCGDERQRSLPGIVGRLGEVLLLAVEEAVRRTVVDDDLVLDACARRAPRRTPRCPRR